MKRLAFGLLFSLLGIVWPIALPFLLIFYFVTRPTAIERDIEKRKAEEAAQREFEERTIAEMDRLRKSMNGAGLEAPDNGTLRFMAEENVKANKDGDRSE